MHHGMCQGCTVFDVNDHMACDIPWVIKCVYPYLESSWAEASKNFSTNLTPWRAIILGLVDTNALIRKLEYFTEWSFLSSARDFIDNSVSVSLLVELLTFWLYWWHPIFHYEFWIGSIKLRPLSTTDNTIVKHSLLVWTFKITGHNLFQRLELTSNVIAPPILIRFLFLFQILQRQRAGGLLGVDDGFIEQLLCHCAGIPNLLGWHATTISIFNQVQNRCVQ